MLKSKHLNFVLFAGLAVIALLVHFEVLANPGEIGVGLVALSTAPFTVTSEHTAVAVGYKNTEDSLIADEVLPRVDVGETFDYTRYEESQMFTVPPTEVGRKSEPNQVNFEGESVTVKVKDYALDDFIPQRDIDVWEKMPKPANGGPVRPDLLAAEGLTNLILLDREIRVANTVFDGSNYNASLKDTLSGTDQWDDYENSDPLADLLEALDEPLVRPNLVVLGAKGWTKLRRNPKLVQAVFNTAQNAGVISRQQLADLLEVDRVLVGGSRVNNARKGQPANFVRTWGNHCALLYVSKQAARTFQPTWGFTGQFGTRFGGTIPDGKKGIKGGNTIRVGEQVREVVAAKNAGFFLENVISG
jgi:hypothetical protein